MITLEMAKFDEVLRGLEICSGNRDLCYDCPYNGNCKELYVDALELLKKCKDRGMRQPRVYGDIYDAAAELESAARYLEFCGDSQDDSMVEITTERHEGQVKIRFAIGQPNAARWVWTIQKQKKFELPDLTEYHESDFDKLKHVYNLLGLDETGGEITRDSLLHAALKITNKNKEATK